MLVMEYEWRWRSATDFYEDGFVWLFEARPCWEYRVAGAFIFLSYHCEEFAVADGRTGPGEGAHFKLVLLSFNAQL